MLEALMARFVNDFAKQSRKMKDITLCVLFLDIIACRLRLRIFSFRFDSSFFRFHPAIGFNDFRRGRAFVLFIRLPLPHWGVVDPLYTD